MESGWGALLPVPILANMSPLGAAARSGQLNVGDQVLALNGVSLVGLSMLASEKLFKVPIQFSICSF